MLEAMKIAKGLLIAEYKGQGHNNSGSLISSIEERVTSVGNTIIGELLVNDYARYLERKTPPSRIPYRRGSGAKTSKYIDGLKRFWKIKGLSDKEALSASFATAAKHKREGRPTQRSYAFSTNGRRTGAIEHAFRADAIKDIEEIFLSERLLAIYSSGIVEASRIAA